MKKLILSLIIIFLTGTLLSQKKSNYEKYIQSKEDSIINNESFASKPEYDDLYYQPSKDTKKIKKHKRSDIETIIDTLVKENPEIEINTYYVDDPFYYSNRIGRFYHGGFNYWMYSNPYYYANNYWMYDSYDWYWEFRFMNYPFWNNYWPYNNFYFVDRYDYWRYNYWNPWRYNYWNPWRHNYGNHNEYYGNNNNRQFNHQTDPGYGRRERPSTLSTNNIGNHQTRPEIRKNVNTRTESRYSENRRSYTPSYNNPRMNTRPQYNNTRPNENNRDIVNRRSGNNSQPHVYSIPSVNQRTEQFRNNSQQSNRSYSEPSRSSNNFNSNSGISRSSTGSSSSGSSNNSGSISSRRR
jgi:hypothetical protein